jgi:DMSO/TMAO reductase YedYZ molybdopterin-dependent catalytic subunit
LPPGQHAAELARCGLPRFARREVNPPAQPVLIVTGEVRHPTQFDVRELMARLPRRGQRSDLPCITTWSALDLAWSGTSLRDVIGLIADVVRPHPGAFWLTPPAPGRLLLESSARRRAR